MIRQAVLLGVDDYLAFARMLLGDPGVLALPECGDARPDDVKPTHTRTTRRGSTHRHIYDFAFVGQVITA